MADELDGLYDSADYIIGTKSFKNLTLRHVKNAKPSDDEKRKPFVPIGADGAVGYIKERGAQGWEVEILPNTREAGIWRELFRTGEKFRWTVQYRAGDRLGERLQGTVIVTSYVEPEVAMGGDVTHTVMLGVVGKMKKTA